MPPSAVLEYLVMTGTTDLPKVVFVLGPPGCGKGTQCAMLQKAMNASLSSKAFLIDGFPRNQDNLEGWEREMASKAKVLFVLYLHCPEEICVRRCLNRNEGRSDDNEESLRKRIKTYCTQTLPIVEHYRTQDLVREVSACGAPEEVSVSGITKFI
ncbi:unnamed protein product [Gongylonema pulchrum]|uniref:Nucleoside-diphosphate kinase n=1 Tax=Gongylonema pulchrum TaxID=637853 RepID=A0A3P7MXB1_9BILA|nr:unnamed protein product [Gongylonema pulchrum]